MPNLTDLPPELFTTIISQVPLCLRTSVVLSLTRALPRSPVPQHALFDNVRLQRPEQIYQLYRRIRHPDFPGRWIRSLSLEAWTADAEVVINLVRLIPGLAWLSIFIGPNNFTPEHLEELLEEPIPSLRSLSLRFRPYVQKATYYQFLKGAYFDSTLLALSEWPKETTLPVLSIVQDPLDPQISQRHAFAQPLVFFRLDPLNTLVSSPGLRDLASLRLRIPSRQLARFITTNPDALPSLEFLDLSTCNVNAADVDMILMRFTSLKHLVLDGCAILRSSDLREAEWRDLGKACAMIGTKRVRERERKLKAWLEEMALRRGPPLNGEREPEVGELTKQPKRGRRGVSTATISLREALPKDNPPRRSGQRRQALPVERIRIIPPLPSLRSFCTTHSSSVPVDRQPAMREAFETGWAEGLSILVATRTRLRQSLANGVVRVTRFTGLDFNGDGLDGLQDVTSKYDEEAFVISPQNDVWISPVICFAGEMGMGEHVGGCGHELGRRAFVGGSDNCLI